MILTKPYGYAPLKRTEGKHGRQYIVGESRPLPSVTTILDKTADKAFLVDWRKRVGDKEANRISTESSSVGNQMHDNLERWVLDGDSPTGSPMARTLARLIIKNGLDKVDEVWGTEVQLYSPELFAGTTDLVGIHEGTPAIMDYKNSRRLKKREWVEDYMHQLVAYAEAHDAMYGTKIHKGVIMVGCWTGDYVEFVLEGAEWDKYVSSWNDRLYSYYKKFGIG